MVARPLSSKITNHKIIHHGTPHFFLSKTMLHSSPPGQTAVNPADGSAVVVVDVQVCWGLASLFRKKRGNMSGSEHGHGKGGKSDVSRLSKKLDTALSHDRHMLQSSTVSWSSTGVASNPPL